MRKQLSFLILLLTLAACSPHMEGLGPRVAVPDIKGDSYISIDGKELPLRIWEAEDEAKAVVLGVHGFNDYGNFLMPGMPAYLNKNSIKLITYDQRGFGSGPDRGLWAGKEALVNDLATMIHLVKSRHENLPLFVLGESMGAAVVINTLSEVKPLPVDGAILLGPAVWGPSSWPWYQKMGLYVTSYTMPWLKLSGGGIVQPTDHIENWKNWSRDPLVTRETRVDSLWGVSWLMDDALHHANDLETPTFLLYGNRDEVIPPEPVAKFVSNLKEGHKVKYYDEGWHWLPRDHNGPKVWEDILSWIKSSTPSIQ